MRCEIGDKLIQITLFEYLSQFQWRNHDSSEHFPNPGPKKINSIDLPHQDSGTNEAQLLNYKVIMCSFYNESVMYLQY